MIRSLRMQIILGMAVSIMLMFLFSTLALHFVLRYRIYSQFKSELFDRARTLAMYVEVERGKLSFESAHYDPKSTMLRDQNDGSGCIFTVWNQPGKQLATRNIFEHFQLPPLYQTHHDGTVQPLTLPDGSSAYMVSFPFTPVHEDQEPIIGPTPQLGITVARRTSSAERTMFWVDITLLGVASVTMLFSGLGIVLLIRLGLKPLGPVLAQLKTIGSGELNQRVNAGKLPVELVSFIKTINDLLAALEIKIANERRFVANAAHELRNPITAVRANLEVGLLHCDNPELREEVQRSSLEAAIHLQTVCERLLSLAGLQQSNIALELQVVDIPELVDGLTEDLSEQAQARQITFEWTQRPNITVTTDPVLLNVIISNLMRNAVAYAPAGSKIQLMSLAADDHVTLTVLNPVDPDRPLDLDKIMEPFWRGDEQHTMDQGHLGLGLTIARSAAVQLQSELSCLWQSCPRKPQSVSDATRLTDDTSSPLFAVVLKLPVAWSAQQQTLNRSGQSI